MKKFHKAVFLDKDGTLIWDIPYNVDPAKICLYEDVPDGLKLLCDNGFKLIVVSNQSGLAYGMFSEGAMKVVYHTLNNLFDSSGAKLSGFYYCPHHPDGKVKKFSVDCNCRKPKPGMIRRAALEMKIDLSLSWMVGDILNDVEAGNAAGCSTILINNGNETEWFEGIKRKPTYMVSSFSEAAGCIVSCSFGNFNEGKWKCKGIK